MNKQVMKIVFGALLVTACGSEAKKSENVATSLPAAAIVRVPVDAKGQEDASKAELRVQQTGSKAETQEDVVAAFNNGSAVSDVKQSTELDGGVSTQAWCYRNYGYGYGYGYSYYPSYYYYGNYYNYGYGKSYYGYGYKYYYYGQGW